MGRARALVERVLPFAETGDGASARGIVRYRRLWLFSVLVTAVGTITALLILNGVNYHLFEKSLETEALAEVNALLKGRERSVRRFLAERGALLRLLVEERGIRGLSDQRGLNEGLQSLKRASGGFTGLEIRKADGSVVARVGERGPDEGVVLMGGASTVFRGSEGSLRFMLGLRAEDEDGEVHELLALLDAEYLAAVVAPADETHSRDAFLIDRTGVLQTPSRYCGRPVLERCGRDLPGLGGHRAAELELDPEGHRRFWGHLVVADTPFVVMAVKRPAEGARSYFRARGRLLGYTLVGALLLFLLIVGLSTFLVFRIRDADIKRLRVMHKAQYTTKMASLGRIAAGVAHEINNPLAIINEKAGLLKDITGLPGEFPRREKVVSELDAIARSVDRCRAVTHRLLGFARRMDARCEPIQLDQLLDEVLSFLETEAKQRSVMVVRNYPGEAVVIQSDRGQLQQVFLNILNNAFEAVSDDGRIDVSLSTDGAGRASVRIGDNGAGIDGKDLLHIFEPFYTTKSGYGTGLGLSITYGIATKLGGDVEVASEPGKGTVFTVTLPLEAPAGDAA